MQASIVRPLIRQAARTFYNLLGHYPTRIRDVRFKADPYHLGFWRSVNQQRWEPETFQVMHERLSGNSIYLDVGAWIGPTVLFAARRSAQVYCIEPDSYAYKYLLWNIQANDLRNVMPFNVALGAKTGLRRMGAPGNRLGDSVTSFVQSGEPAQMEVLCLGWSHWLEFTKVDRIDFIKIDIEGGEFELVPAMRDYLRSHKPIVYLSIHAPLLPAEERAQRLGELLDVMGVYPKCYGEQRDLVSIASVKEVSRGENRTYLFTT